jgi:hypothetical protein
MSAHEDALLASAREAFDALPEAHRAKILGALDAWLDGYPSPTPPEPDPVPTWRRLVDPCTEDRRPDDVALARALWLLTCIAEGDGPDKQLAQLVAVCEAQVGDGWQVGPDAEGIPAHRRHVDVLVYTMGSEDRWERTGNRAAAWLKSLTEATS